MDPPLTTSPPVKYCGEFSCNTPSPAFTNPPALTTLPVTFSVAPATTCATKVPALVGPAEISGTLKFSTPASARIPPEFTVNCVRSATTCGNIPKLPPESSVRLLTNALAANTCVEDNPTFKSGPPDTRVPTEDSSSVLNSGRNPELPLVRKPVPTPLEVVSPRISGRMLIV